MSGILDALDALEVTSPTSYIWLGQHAELPEHILELAPPRVWRNALVQSIGRRLYNDFFSVGSPRPTVQGWARSRRRLAEQLAAANAGSGWLDEGWTFLGRDGPRFIVERGGLRLWVEERELGSPGAAGDLVPGAIVAIRLANDAPVMAPGCYMALGDRGFDPPRPPILDRFYLHVRCEGAVPLMRLATKRLNGAGLAFRLKVVDDPDGFDRCDTAIFAFQRADRARALRHVIAIHREMRAELDAAVPAMTKLLAPGLAFAEDPGEGRSFGAHRCDLLAEAIVTASERGAVELDARLRHVAERFAQAGTSVESPHLGPDSPGDIELEPIDLEALDKEHSPCP